MNQDELTMISAISNIYRMMVFAKNGEVVEMNTFLCGVDKDVLKAMSELAFIIAGTIHTELKLSK